MAHFQDRSGEKIDKYRLLRLLGEGGFSEVYLAEERPRQNQVAIKIIRIPLTNPEQAKAFIKEARTFRLKHPHIVPLLDFGMSQQYLPFLVMEYIAGGTLRSRYPKGTQVPLDKVVSYASQIASALQYAHDQRLIHRDVKPENMLWQADDRILLSDFGLAEVSHASSSIDVSKQVAGTLPYMAPEQHRGKPCAESDQYALAVVVYEWLAGARPFQGTGPEIAIQHLHAEPPSLVEQLPTLPKQVEQVVFRALAKAPKDRFSSIQDFAIALQGASQSADLPPSLFFTSQIVPSQSVLLSPLSEKQAGSDSPIQLPEGFKAPLSVPVHLPAPDEPLDSDLLPEANKDALLQQSIVIPSIQQQKTLPPLLIVRWRPSWSLLLFILIVALLLGVSGRGIYLLVTSARTSQASYPATPTSTVPVAGIASPVPSVTPSATSASSATAMAYYSQYTGRQPAQEYTSANSHQWVPGSLPYGNCENKGSQGYHSIAHPQDINTCIAPLPHLTGDFAAQATVTILQGVGAGLVFGFSPASYNGPSYIWSFCITAGCPARAAYLDYGFNGGGGECLGPHPSPDYRLNSDQYCTNQYPVIDTNVGQSNTLTVIILHGTIYMYINATFIWSVATIPSTGAIYPTSGQVGIAALSGKDGSTDVVLQYLKVWPIQD